MYYMHIYVVYVCVVYTGPQDEMRFLVCIGVKHVWKFQILLPKASSAGKAVSSWFGVGAPRHPPPAASLYLQKSRSQQAPR